MTLTRRATPRVAAGCVALYLTLVPVWPAPARTAVSDADTTGAFPEKRRNRSAWEYAVNAPFKLAYLPVGLTFDATKEVVEFVYDKKIVTRVRAFLVSEDGRTGVVPIATPRRGAGAKFFRRGWASPDSRLAVSARAALNGRQDYSFEVERVPLVGGPVAWGFFAGYERASDEQFFGVGMDNDPDRDETNYARELGRAEVRLGAPLGERLYFASTLGVEHDTILDGEDKRSPSTLAEFPPPALPGTGDQEVRFGQAGIEIEYDSRDEQGSPTRGWLVTAAGRYHADLEEERYEFWKLGADARAYVDMFYRRVLMVRVATEVTESVASRAVPFYHLSELGSHGTIRGFSTGRFRGADALAATLEYSWPIARRADCLLFADAGQVLARLDDVDVNLFEVGWGGGFRVYSRRDAIASLEIGKSRDEWRVYFALN